MADTVTLRIRETGATKVAGGFRKVDRSLSRMGRTGKAAAAGISRGIGRLGGMLSRVAGLAGGLGVALGGRALLKFDDALGQLQADANMSTGEIMKLRDRMLKLSRAHGIAKEELVAGAQEWQDYTGILKQMIPVMGDVAKIHKATGTPMKELATISAALMQSLNLKPKGAVDAMAKLNEQSRAGSVNMRKAARVLPELLAAGAGYGFKGTRGATQMGMLLQTAGGAYGGKAEEARTGALAVLRDLTKNAAKLKKMGVQVFDPNAPGQMRDIDKVMGEIVAKTGGVIAGKKGMGSIFTEESIKAAMAFTNRGAVGSQLAAGKRGGMGTIAEQLERKLTGVAAESEKVKKAMAALDAGFQETGKKLLAWAAQNPLMAGGAAAGGWGAMKGAGMLFRWLAGRGGKGAGGGLGGLGGKPIPVYVVNNPGGGAGGGAKGAAGRLGGMALAGVVGAAGGAAMLVGAHSAGQKALLARKKAAEINVANNARQVGMRTLVQQAGQLGGLGRRGVGSYESQGGRHELTQANALATLQASAAQQGVSAEAFKALLPVLKQLTSHLAKGTKVTVQAPGIDKPKVAVSRG